MAFATRFALAALAALSVAAPAGIVTPAHANYSCEPGQPNCTPMNLLGSHDTPWPEIACRAKGDPQDRPDDLRFTNVGDVAIRAGTPVFWQLKLTGESGWFTVPADLPQGASVKAVDLLAQGVPDNTRCTSRIA